MEYNNRLTTFTRSLSRQMAFKSIGEVDSYTICDRLANHMRSLIKSYVIASACARSFHEHRRFTYYMRLPSKLYAIASALSVTRTLRDRLAND